MNSSFDYSDDSDHIYYPEYSESPKLNEEFGPESQSSSESESEQVEPIRASQKNEASNTMSSAATFKEQVGKAISRLCNDSIPFCVSGKIEKAPIIAISIPKVICLFFSTIKREFFWIEKNKIFGICSIKNAYPFHCSNVSY